MLGLAPGAHARPDASLVASIAKSAHVRLEWLRSVSTALHVFALQADGDDPDCARALARLRADSRVVSADIDSRRAAHGPAG